MPMLDEEEYAEILEVYRQCAIATKEFREQWKLPLHDTAVQERFGPLRRRYEELTGVQESNQNAIMHHRLSLTGHLASGAGNRCVRRRRSCVGLVWRLSKASVIGCAAC